MIVYYWGRTPVAFLRKSGTPGSPAKVSGADYIAVDLAPGGERWYSNAGFFADLDGDGHLDFVIGNYFQDGARILDASASGQEEMHNTKSRSYNGGSKRVLLWESGEAAPDPAVRFRQMPDIFGDDVNHGWTLGAGAADLDGDLLPEIYFANDFGPDRLLHNRSTPGHARFALLQGERHFTTPASFVLGHDSFKGMGVDFADLNGDGIPDIFVSNIADQYALEESHFLWLSTGDTGSMKTGRAPYEQASERLGLSRSGWGWDVRLADFDNDGRLEALQATGFIRGTVNRWPELQALGTSNDGLIHNPGFWPRFRQGDDVSGRNRNAFFVRGADGRFHDVAAELGLASQLVSRGIAVADVDGDGKLDFAVANQWNDSYFYHNASPSPGYFLGLHLLLPLKGDDETLRLRPGHPGSDMRGLPAVGASATVHLPDGKRMSAQVDGGSGHSGKRSPELHFGLGSIPGGPRLRVDLSWRDSRGRVNRRQVIAAVGWNTVVLGR
jgi:hypothetical protein